MDFNQSALQSPDLELGEASIALESCLQEFDTFIDAITLDASTEALTQMLASLKSISGNFTKSLTQMLTLGERKYHTEFADWRRKSSRMIVRVEKMPYSVTSGKLVDYPTGMVGKYPEVVTGGVKFQQSFDIRAALRTALDSMDMVQVAINNGKGPDVDKKLRSALVEISGVAKKAIPAHGVLLGMFNVNDTRMQRTEFGKMFDNMSELSTYRKKLGTVDTLVSDVPSISKAVTTLESSVDVIVTYLVDGPHDEGEFQPTSNFVKGFATYIKHISELISAYGDVSLRTMVLEHNTVLMYNTLAGK